MVWASEVISPDVLSVPCLYPIRQRKLLTFSAELGRRKHLNVTDRMSCSEGTDSIAYSVEAKLRYINSGSYVSQKNGETRADLKHMDIG